MAYGLDSGQLMIKEPTIKIGTVLAPETIGTDVDDPRVKFTGDLLSYTEQGSISLTIPKTYAEFINSTPGQLIRKDVTLQSMILETSVAQWNAELLTLALGATTQFAYAAITNPGAQTQDIVHVGTSPAGQCAGQSVVALLIEGERLDCIPFYAMIYAAIVTPDSVDWTSDGSSYTTMALKFEATAVAAITDDSKNLGMFGFVTAS